MDFSGSLGAVEAGAAHVAGGVNSGYRIVFRSNPLVFAGASESPLGRNPAKYEQYSHQHSNHNYRKVYEKYLSSLLLSLDSKL